MKRRQFLSFLGLAGFTFRSSADDHQTTPSQTEGPFYPLEPIPLRADLVRDKENLIGQAIQLKGQVLGLGGKALANSKIEIWQCDGNGLYSHPAQRGTEGFDPSFSGSGAQLTNAQGQYEFTTLYPAAYPGRPPHIHVKIWLDDNELLTTQLYLVGNTGGGWFESKRKRLQINPQRGGDGLVRAEFSFVV